MGAGAQKSGGAAGLPAPPPPRSLLFSLILSLHVYVCAANETILNERLIIYLVIVYKVARD